MPPPQHESPFSQPPPPPEKAAAPPIKKTIDQIIAEQGLYPREAFDFVRRGLSYTVERIHASLTDPAASRHVSGQQLCEGLREFALGQWGLMARTVLRSWNVTRTEDFGTIVFTLVENGEMSRTEQDTLDDFKHVYDFAAVFAPAAYPIDGRIRESRS